MRFAEFKPRFKPAILEIFILALCSVRRTNFDDLGLVSSSLSVYWHDSDGSHRASRPTTTTSSCWLNSLPSRSVQLLRSRQRYAATSEYRARALFALTLPCRVHMLTFACFSRAGTGHRNRHTDHGLPTSHDLRRCTDPRPLASHCCASHTSPRRSSFWPSRFARRSDRLDLVWQSQLMAGLCRARGASSAFAAGTAASPRTRSHHLVLLGRMYRCVFFRFWTIFGPGSRVRPNECMRLRSTSSFRPRFQAKSVN